MLTDDEEIPPFFRELQDLANKHDVLVYATVAVVVRDGKPLMATAGGSKLPDDDAKSLEIYAALGRAFDEVIRRLSSPAPNRGMMN